MSKVFISYCHKDEKWKDQIVVQLGVLEKERKLAVWDDRRIDGGDNWIPEIEQAMQECDVALLLISADFLNSGFILGKEVPKLLERRVKEGIRVIPVILRPCPWTHVTCLSGIQARPLDGKPLSSFSKPKAEAALYALAEEVLHLVTAPPASKHTSTSLRFNFDHLIESHTRIFAGRESFIQKIANFIDTQSSGYIFVEALSGYGKTSLLAKLVQDNQHFAYHFISQTYKNQNSDFDSTQMQSLLLNLCEQLDLKREDYKGCTPKARLQDLLRSSPTKGQRVVVIDAIDEVDNHPNFLLGVLPTNLPAGVFIILSARKSGERDYLTEIGLRRNKMKLLIELPGLDETDIAELLRFADGKALTLADSRNLVLELKQVSRGDPFYLRFLVEDVIDGIITPENIDRIPSGLNEYLDIQFSILDRNAYLSQQRDILGLIIQAHGPLSRCDLVEMVEGIDWLNFDNIIKDIHRFLLVYDNKYTFCHSRFKEYFATKALKLKPNNIP